MRKELLKSVSSIPDKTQQPAFHEHSETVFIARLTREERVKNSRLIIAVVHEFRRNCPPAIAAKLRAGSRIKITTLPDVAEPVKKGGGDAKK